jgi:hypothetical protein
MIVLRNGRQTGLCFDGPKREKLLLINGVEKDKKSGDLTEVDICPDGAI